MTWVVAWLPSLLPLGSVLQGVVCGLLAAIGYGIGASAAATARVVSRQPRRRPEPRGDRGGPAATPRWYRFCAGAAAAVAILAGWPLSGGLRVQAVQLGAPQLAVNALVATVIGVLLAALLVLAGRGLRAASRRFARLFQRGLRQGGSPGSTSSPALAPGSLALLLGALADTSQLRTGRYPAPWLVADLPSLRPLHETAVADAFRAAVAATMPTVLPPTAEQALRKAPDQAAPMFLTSPRAGSARLPALTMFSVWIARNEPMPLYTAWPKLSMPPCPSSARP